MTLPYLSVFAGLQFDKYVIDDKVEIGEQSYAFSFKFKNDAKIPVKILSIETTCGCTVARNSKEVYQAKDVGEIEGVFNLGDRRGLQEKSIFIKTDSIDDGRIELVLRISIENPVEISSKLLYWKEGEKLDAKTITIKTAKAFPLIIESAESESAYIKVEYKQISPEEIKIVATPKEFIKDEVKPIKICVKKKNGEKTIYVVYTMLK